MATAAELLAQAASGKGCLGRAIARDPNTPVFLLVADDNLAADLVELWVIRARANRVTPQDKLIDAQAIVDDMRAWYRHKHPD